MAKKKARKPPRAKGASASRSTCGKATSRKSPGGATRTASGGEKSGKRPSRPAAKAGGGQKPARRPGAARKRAPAKPQALGSEAARAGSTSTGGAAGGRTRTSRLTPKRRNSKLSRRQLEKIRSLLVEKKSKLTDHLRNELSVLERPEKRHRADLEEMASDTHDTDSVCEIMDIESTQIDQIDTALRKIENGTYGICEDCGQEIGPARLEALPFASQCIECKRRSERLSEYSPYAS